MWTKLKTEGPETWVMKTTKGWCLSVTGSVIELEDPDHKMKLIEDTVEPPVVTPPVVVPPVEPPVTPPVTPPVVTPPTTPVTKTFILGTNAAEIADWQPDLPFANQMYASRPWISNGTTWDDGRPLSLDSDGNVKSLLSGQSAMTLLFWDINEKALTKGKYKLTWTGEGTFTVQNATVVSTAANEMIIDVQKTNVQLRITKVGATSYPKNISFVHVDNKSKLLNDKFVTAMSKYKVLRTMDWQHTNFGTQTNPADIIPATACRFTSGISPEMIGAVAEELKIDPWVCIPHRATDAYVTAFLTRLKAAMPTRSLYCEYSNESWLGTFPGHAWVKARGMELKLAATEYDAGMLYHAKRSSEVGVIAKSIWGAKVTTIMGVQASVSWWANEMLKANKAVGIDAICGAPYFGDDVGQGTIGTAVANETLDQLFARLKNTSMVNSKKWVTEQTKVATDHKVRFIAYEGGQHLVGVGALQDNAKLNALFDAAQTDPRMGELYTEFLDHWKATTNDLFCHFNLCSSWNKYGRWGATRFHGDTNPKTNALK